MKTRRTHLIVAIIVAAIAVAALAAGVVYAALKDTTSVVNNTLEPAHVTCSVVETFDGSTKSDVKVRNTGDIPALIRVKVVINWVDSDGYVAYNPDTNYRYTATLASPLNWTNGSGAATLTEGYWYYNGIVQPGETTEDLIASVVENLGAPVASDPQYRLQVNVFAEAIQAAPSDAVQGSWHMTYSDGAWSTSP